MIKEISLRKVLPEVFRDVSDRPPVSESGVWLRDISFRRGTHYLVLAESGTGKSSLCSFIYGNRRDYSGSILFDGRDSRTFSIDEWCALRRTSLALLPQEMRLFPELTAIENIELKNRLTGFKTRAEIMDMLAALRIGDKAESPAARLSIGQQQRVAIVRALCQPFDFLLLDEPVSHLDARSNADVAALILRQAESQGAAVIATSVGNNIAIPSPETLLL